MAALCAFTHGDGGYHAKIDEVRWSIQLNKIIYVGCASINCIYFRTLKILLPLKQVNIAALKKYFGSDYLMPVISGLLMGLSLFDHFEWVCFIAFIPLFYNWTDQLQNKSFLKYFVSGFVTLFLYSLFVFYWIRHAGESYFLFTLIPAYLFYVLFCMLFAVQWGIVAVTFAYVGRCFKLLSLFFLPFSFFVVDEIAYQFMQLHFGFHWYTMQISGLSWAKYVGLPNLGLLVIIINLFMYLLIRRIHLGGAAAGLAVIAIILFLEPARFETNSNNVAGETMLSRKVLILGIQGQVSNELKRNDLQVSQDQILTMDHYYSKTRAAMAAHPNAELIVWPETAMPVVWSDQPATDEPSERRLKFQKDVETFVGRIQKPVLTGGYFNDQGNYNSVIYMQPQQEKSVHSQKAILFPLGEVIPFNDFWGLTANYFPEVPRFSQNRPPKIITVTDKVKILAPICYESLFDRYYQENLKDAQLIVNLTNDGWFKSKLERKWHALMSLSHSVEYGLPIYRLTNDGISALADVKGHYQLFDEKADYIFSEVSYSEKSTQTFYKKNGEFVLRIPRYIAYLLLLLTITAKYLKNYRQDRLLDS